MTLTGKTLFEMWLSETELKGVTWDNQGLIAQAPWDALAEKLNGMMAGSPPEIGEPERATCVIFGKDKMWALHLRDGEEHLSTATFSAEHFALGTKLIIEEPIVDDADRARHKRDCPYRHGGEIKDCKC